MNADLSVAPEIAQLAAPPVPGQGDAPVLRTAGRVAARLADLAATPERWWDTVRFDPHGPVRVQVPGMPDTWLLVLPPGATATCDCGQATALAGEAVELPGQAVERAAETVEAGERQGRPLRPGRVLVHGARAPHRLHAAGPGYSVTLHAAAS